MYCTITQLPAQSVLLLPCGRRDARSFLPFIVFVVVIRIVCTSFALYPLARLVTY